MEDKKTPPQLTTLYGKGYTTGTFGISSNKKVKIRSSLKAPVKKNK